MLLNRLNKSKALSLGAFTILPILYIWAMAAFIHFAVKDSSDVRLFFNPIAVIHLVMMAEVAVLVIFYLTHLFKTDIVPQNKKLLWAFVLLVGNLISMPLYWYFYIWKEASPV